MNYGTDAIRNSLKHSCLRQSMAHCSYKGGVESMQSVLMGDDVIRC